MKKCDELWVFGNEQFTAKDNPEIIKDVVPYEKLDDVTKSQVSVWCADKPLHTIKYITLDNIIKKEQKNR